MTALAKGWKVRALGISRNVPTRFPALRFMTALKAARDFGLPAEQADAIALRFDPRHAHDQLADALTAALIESGAVRVPDTA
jgi:hypothetical protein